MTFLQRTLTPAALPSLLVAAVLGLTGCTGAGQSSTMETAPPPPPPSDEPIVAVIAGELITLEAFEDNYLRNGVSPGVESSSLQEYEDFLERYVDFRVKVLEARSLGLHEDESLQDEIAQYRTQLARPFLLERNVFEPLVAEMYERRREAVSASHILIRLAENATPSDTLAAWNSISSVRDSVLAGAPFGQMAVRFSQDPSAQGAAGTPGSQGQLGYFGGGRMVAEFEDAAFNTDVGAVSEPFRSSFGYHILTVTDRRPMPADRQLAHIMLRQQGGTPAEQAAVESRIDSVRARLEAGDAFADVARDLSQDQNSAPQGGGIGTLAFDAGLPFAFRDAAFAIQEKGGWTGPVRTNFGWHFIQYLDDEPLGTLEEEYDELKTRVSQLPRSQKAEKEFAAQTRAEVGTWVDSTRFAEWDQAMAPDSLIRWLATLDTATTPDDGDILRFGSTSVGLGGFAEYFRSAVVPVMPTTAERLYAVADRWFDEQAMEYEMDRLEERNSEFATTMADFRDGLLLFRFMEQKVWNAAAQDSTALQELFESRPESYQFPDRTRIISYTSTSKVDLELFIDSVRNQGVEDAWAAASMDSSLVLRADTTFIAEPTGSLFDTALSMDQGSITDPQAFNQGWIAMLNAGQDPTRRMTFEEARSEVINDLQTKVEEDLMSELRDKYGVRTFPAELSALIEAPVESR